MPRGCWRQHPTVSSPQVLLPTNSHKQNQHPREQEGETQPSNKPQGKQIRTATEPPPELRELPPPYRSGFAVHRPLQRWAGLTAPAQPSFAAQRELRFTGTGQDLFGEQVRTSVPAPGAEGNQSNLPPGSAAACFPTAPGTACKTPASLPATPAGRWGTLGGGSRSPGCGRTCGSR